MVAVFAEVASRLRELKPCKLASLGEFYSCPPFGMSKFSSDLRGKIAYERSFWDKEAGIDGSGWRWIHPTSKSPNPIALSSGLSHSNSLPFAPQSLKRGISTRGASGIDSSLTFHRPPSMCMGAPPVRI